MVSLNGQARRTPASRTSGAEPYVTVAEAEAYRADALATFARAVQRRHAFDLAGSILAAARARAPVDTGARRSSVRWDDLFGARVLRVGEQRIHFEDTAPDIPMRRVGERWEPDR